MQVARLLEGEHERTGARQAPADRARTADRAAADEGRDPAALSAPRAVRRQHRGRARGVARLFRQGAGAACRSARRRCWSRCRNRPRPAGPIAIADAAPSAPATACSTRGRQAGVITAAEAERAKSRARADRAPRVSRKLAPHLAESEVARRARAADPSADARSRAASGLGDTCRRADEARSAQQACRPPSSSSITRPARSSPTSARPTISTTPGSAPSTWCGRCARRARL